jgi:hypothetical protein
MVLPSVGRTVALATVTAAVVAAGGGAAWALNHHQHGGRPVPMYRSAAAMAQKAGCANSFHSLAPPPLVQSAGWCRIDGQLVDFRVQRVINTANVWPSKSGGRLAPNIVSNGWVVHSGNVRVLDRVGARLDP